MSLFSTVISALWDSPANKDVVDAFMNNKLCVNAAKGDPDALAAYRKYAAVGCVGILIRQMVLTR